MAKDKGKPAAEVAEGAPKKGKGKLMVIIIAAVVLLAGGGGAAWYFLSAKKTGQEGKASHEESAKPPVFLRLETFTVKLLTSDGEEHYLQTDIELKVANPKVVDKVKSFMPEIRNNILLLLSSKTASALAPVDGKRKLSIEIKGEVNKVIHAKEADGVAGVFFTSFVIQ